MTSCRDFRANLLWTDGKEFHSQLNLFIGDNHHFNCVLLAPFLFLLLPFGKSSISLFCLFWFGLFLFFFSFRHQPIPPFTFSSYTFYMDSNQSILPFAFSKYTVIITFLTLHVLFYTFSIKLFFFISVATSLFLIFRQHHARRASFH